MSTVHCRGTPPEIQRARDNQPAPAMPPTTTGRAMLLVMIISTVASTAQGQTLGTPARRSPLLRAARCCGRDAVFDSHLGECQGQTREAPLSWSCSPFLRAGLTLGAGRAQPSALHDKHELFFMLVPASPLPDTRACVNVLASRYMHISTGRRHGRRRIEDGANPDYP